ncbi:MAG: efflux RND transporter periplasmic adaptor subunit, partial [Acidobacteriota bacterium]
GGRVWILTSCLLFVALLGLSLYAFWWEPSAKSASAPAVAAADDQTAVPEALPAEPPDREVLIASGYVVAHHKHELGSKVMGRVQWIGVERGDFVRKGQLLVKLEDREYRAQLGQAQASFKSAQDRLVELERGPRPQEIERARAELARARADRENARLDFERLQRLLGSGVIAQQEVDNAKARWEMAAASVDSAQESYALLEAGTREEQIRQARAEVERTRAAVEYAQTMLDATEIRAPVTGTVLRRIAEVGEMITTSYAGTSGAKSAAVALADLNDLQVEMDISQTDFSRITPDLDCIMTPEAYPDRKYRCEIDEISPEANRQNASIQVKVKVLEPDDYLRPEMSARVTFLKREGKNDG